MPSANLHVSYHVIPHEPQSYWRGLRYSGWVPRRLLVMGCGPVSAQSVAAWQSSFASAHPWNAPEARGWGSGVPGGSTPMGGHGSNRLLLPKRPSAPVSGPAKAPGCLGTFPNKYARAASLSGKHGLPLPPPYYHHPCQLCLVGTLWGQRMAWESGHLGPNSILETQDLGQVSVHPEPASSMYWDAPPSWRTRWEG